MANRKTSAVVLLSLLLLLNPTQNRPGACYRLPSDHVLSCTYFLASFLTAVLYASPVMHLLCTSPATYTSAYIHHRRSFAAHTSGGPENSWSMSALWPRAIMAAIVEPKRSSLPRVMGPSKILCDMYTCDVYSHNSLCTSSVTYISPYIHHRASSVAQISDGKGNSRSMLALARGVMEPIVEPKRSSLRRVMGPSKMLYLVRYICRPVM